MVKKGLNRTELLQVRYRNSRWQIHSAQFEIPQRAHSEEIGEPIDPEIRKQIEKLTEEARTFRPIENWTQ
jgi:hypothetical protein